MAGKGGYQAPAKPANTSGPGAFARRTDGSAQQKMQQAERYVSGMPNYGDGQDMMQIQSGAPMAATPNPGQAPAAGQAQPGVPPQGFIGAHQPNPAEIITSGVGGNTPGPGPEALNLPSTAGISGAQSALSLLNQLGNNASQQVKAIRTALAAHVNNTAQAPAPTAASAMATPAPMAGNQ